MPPAANKMGEESEISYGVLPGFLEQRRSDAVGHMEFCIKRHQGLANIGIAVSFVNSVSRGGELAGDSIPALQRWDPVRTRN